jgi:uncharacterized iron-regulated membrane protein
MKAINYRKLHLKIALIFSLPLLIISLSGILLITKHFFPQLQSQTMNAEKIQDKPLATIDNLIQVAKKDSSIEQIIIRPQKNNITVRYKNYEESQFHAQTLEHLGTSTRHSTWIIKLHQGTLFGDWVRDFIFIPTAIGFFLLWITGVILYINSKRKRS